MGVGDSRGPASNSLDGRKGCEVVKRFHGILYMLACSVLLHPGTAYAQGGGRGWLERLSGPGPFEGGSYELRVVCFFEDSKDELSDLKWLWQTTFVEGEPQPRSCWRDTNSKLKAYVLVGTDWFTSQENHLLPPGTDADFSEVRLRTLRPAFMLRLHSTLDAGVGFGLNWFSGDAFDSFFRASFQPIRVVWTPLAAFGNKPWTRVLRVPVDATVFGGTFTNEDFGARGSDFSERGEWLWSTGVIIDIGSFLTRRK